MQFNTSQNQARKSLKHNSKTTEPLTMLLAKAAIFLLWIGSVVDPIGNMFGLRYLALAISFLALTWLISTRTIKRIEISLRTGLILQVSFVFPLYGLLLYAFRAGAGEFVDTSYLASGVLMFTSLLYRSRSMCLFGINCLVISTRLLSILVIAAFTSQLLGGGEWISFFTERSVAVISTREYAGVTLPYIYFLASPLLIALMAHDFGRLTRSLKMTDLAIFGVTAFSFALTGTRAHILLAIFFVPIYLLLISNPRTMLKSIILITGVGLTVLILDTPRALLSAFFSTSETSNFMKVALLYDYGNIFSNPLDLVFGQGFNAHEWSPTLREMIAMEVGASKTELTYIELVRVFGVGFAALFIITLLLLLKSLKGGPSDLQWIYPGLTIYLINAAVNPYLFSINGILPLGLFASLAYYSHCYNIKDKSNQPSAIKVMG